MLSKKINRDINIKWKKKTKKKTKKNENCIQTHNINSTGSSIQVIT